jgi:predicted DNA-binding transcriptional regulator YafY
MSFLEKLRTLKRFHHLIIRSSTGSIPQIMCNLDISRATIFRYVELLENLGAEIYFCRDRNSYCYRREFELNFDSLIF